MNRNLVCPFFSIISERGINILSRIISCIANENQDSRIWYNPCKCTFLQ
jgi:hypothetical protein